MEIYSKTNTEYEYSFIPPIWTKLIKLNKNKQEK